MVKVRRIVATYDIGTLMNDKTGINQLEGGIVWGVSFALHEHTVIDPGLRPDRQRELRGIPRSGQRRYRHTGRDRAQHPGLEVQPTGRWRGIGEIGITGAAAAVANAIYNARPVPVSREYPITPDKIMQGTTLRA